MMQSIFIPSTILSGEGTGLILGLLKQVHQRSQKLGPEAEVSIGEQGRAVGKELDHRDGTGLLLNDAADLLDVGEPERIGHHHKEFGLHSVDCLQHSGSAVLADKKGQEDDKRANDLQSFRGLNASEDQRQDIAHIWLDLIEGQRQKDALQEEEGQMIACGRREELLEDAKNRLQMLLGELRVLMDGVKNLRERERSIYVTCGALTR